MCALDFADFQPALHAATVMNAFERPWCLAGGWAIDVWLGRLTRAHAGVMIAIFREDQIALRDFLGRRWRWWILSPRGARAWRDDRQMLMQPVRVLRAAPIGATSPIDFLLNESDSVDWIHPRDGRIRWPREQWCLRGAFGVPVISPHLALLYKAERASPGDELDLRSSLPMLAPELRRWLVAAIGMLDANHPWLARCV